MRSTFILGVLKLTGSIFYNFESLYLIAGKKKKKKKK